MMKVYSALETIPQYALGSVLVIGNFDGVHRGHKALLDRAQDIAKTSNKPFGVLTFEPHPRRLFRPDEPPARITPEAIKARRLEAYDAQLLFSLTFDWDFASQSAEAFIGNVLKNGIKPSHIIVGYDFQFGQMRKGTPDTLKEAGYDVTVVEKVESDGGEAFSSSRIRQLLRQGEIEEANNLLGWDWEMEGSVFRGDRRGHELGYPTANVLLGETLHPAYGVYAALVNIEGEDEWLPSATNIGIRPMFEVPEGQVEAHILDFDRDIYDRTIRIRPVQRLRSEAKFESIDALKDQMAKDCVQAREILIK